jgi:hypothetical protein
MLDGHVKEGGKEWNRRKVALGRNYTGRIQLAKKYNFVNLLTFLYISTPLIKFLFSLLYKDIISLILKV